MVPGDLVHFAQRRIVERKALLQLLVFTNRSLNVYPGLGGQCLACSFRASCRLSFNMHNIQVMHC